jgi:hypothetical protein
MSPDRKMFIGLRPGSMGAPDPTGGPAGPKPPEFAGSLAESIENAFNALLVTDGMDPLPVDNNLPETRDRRRLFVAIAQGLTNYLDERRVRFTFDALTRVPTDETLTIDVDPTL